MALDFFGAAGSLSSGSLEQSMLIKAGGPTDSKPSRRKQSDLKRMTELTPIATETAAFPHAMLREIYEQPQALAATIERYVPGGVSTAETFQPVVDALGRRERLVIAASGSSRHAGLAGEIMLEDLAGIPVDVEYAS